MMDRNAEHSTMIEIVDRILDINGHIHATMEL